MKVEGVAPRPAGTGNPGGKEPSAWSSPRQHHQVTGDRPRPWPLCLELPGVWGMRGNPVPALGSPLILLGDLGSLAPLSLHLAVCEVGTGTQPCPLWSDGKTESD